MRDPSSNASVSDITRDPLRHQVGTLTVRDGSPVATTVLTGSGNNIGELAMEDFTAESAVARHGDDREKTFAAG
jgi:hypothetical protein